ncbi:MAG: T9SS type A sorting domain-containing protein [Saprospiraceae bacterium]|nr:T9SS type A sorting domain-containing protein [Saprospiraceae bacterium]
MHRILSLLFCLAGPFLYAQYGALDPTFGNDGFVITPSGMGNDLVIQPDGKILVTGSLYDSMDHLALIRHLSNGERDPSFGNNGIVLLPDQPYGAVGWQIALQSDGKILVAGGHGFSGPQPSDLLLVRFVPEGQLDPSFGSNGIVSWDALGDREILRALVIQRDGKILVAGEALETALGIRLFLVRFRSDGQLDTGFGNGGALLLDYGITILYTTGLGELNDGKLILCASYVLPQEAVSDIFLMRFMPDGSPDLSFGNNGTLRHNFGYYQLTRPLLVQPDGKYLVLTNPEDLSQQFAVARFLPDGQADTDFGEQGLAIVRFGQNTIGASSLDVAIQPDGKIISVGSVKNIDPLVYDELVVARFLYNGALDLTFGDSGVVRTNFLPEAQDVALAVALQPDHKIVVTGYTHPANDFNIILARYLSNYEPPPYDTSARDELFGLYPNPTSGAFTVQFGLSRSITVSLDMYDAQGRFLQTLLHPQVRAEGIYTEPLVLDSTIPSGAYFLVMIRDGVRRSLAVVKQY